MKTTCFSIFLCFANSQSFQFHHNYSLIKKLPLDGSSSNSLCYIMSFYVFFQKWRIRSHRQVGRGQGPQRIVFVLAVKLSQLPSTRNYTLLDIHILCERGSPVFHGGRRSNMDGLLIPSGVSLSELSMLYDRTLSGYVGG